MAEQVRKKVRLSLSGYILIGLVLGVLSGVFFGEYCAFLNIFGDAFIKLLQMSILPYIIVSLIVGIGRLSYSEAKTLAIKAGLLLLGFWGIAIAVVLVMPMAFPSTESASFFSTSLLEVKKEVDFLDLFIPSNPFRSMSNNVIPATVIFSIAIGIALIGIKEKFNLIEPLSTLSKALTRVAHYVVYLTPLGVFAISASAAGTMTLEEFGRLQVYFITFNIAAILLTFWILPMLLTALTPFKYRDVVGLSKDALVTGFSTGNLFIILPVLIENCKNLFRKYKLDHEDTDSSIDIIVPVSFNFPNLGKLLILLFILYAAWFSGNPLKASKYPTFIFTGLFSFFGGVDIALPFLLDSMQLPSDLFQLYIVTGIINGRFATLVAAMNLLVFTMLATCAITGNLSVNWKRLLSYSVVTALIMTGVITGTRTFLSYSMSDAYTKDRIIAGMQISRNPAAAVVHKRVPPLPPATVSGGSRLKRIQKRGVIRVGYMPDRLPFSYFNREGDLVGFDVEMAHRLAGELGVDLEFIPFKIEKMVKQLHNGHFDLIMSSIPVTTDWLEDVNFSASPMDVTFAVIVKDYRRDEFRTIESIKSIEGLTIGVPHGQKYFVDKLKKGLPLARVVAVESVRDYFEKKGGNLDALLFSAEGGSAWTLLYPEFQVIVPQPNVLKQPLGYPIAKNDQEMVNFMNRWIDLKKKDRTIERAYNYWILGQGTTEKKPRWSIIRNVLHWVD